MEKKIARGYLQFSRYSDLDRPTMIFGVIWEQLLWLWSNTAPRQHRWHSDSYELLHSDFNLSTDSAKYKFGAYLMLARKLRQNDVAKHWMMCEKSLEQWESKHGQNEMLSTFHKAFLSVKSPFKNEKADNVSVVSSYQNEASKCWSTARRE